MSSPSSCGSNQGLRQVIPDKFSSEIAENLGKTPSSAYAGTMGIVPPARSRNSSSHTVCAIFALTVILVQFIVGCADPKTPDLLEVTGLGPQTVEPNSEIRIEGSGFPENRSGKLTLTGVAHTPARPPREVEWVLPLVADSRATIVLRPALHDLQELTEGAAHVTFRGNARVSFPPVVEGRPPLRGSKTDLVLDLFLPEASATDPKPFLTFVGLDLTDDLVVRDVTRDGVADRSGLQVGDRLHVLDGVRLDSPRDFLPQARAKTSVVTFSRKGFRGNAEVQLPHPGFQLLDHAVAARAIAIALGICLALLWSARPPRFLIWLFGDKAPGRKGRIVLLPQVGQRSQFLAYPVFLVVVLGFFWLSEQPLAPLVGLDFFGALATGGLLLLVSAFLLGGIRTASLRFSLLGALHATVQRLLVLLPVMIAALVRASDTGSLGLYEMGEAQGHFPTHWALFESPFTFLLAVSFLIALVPISGRRAPLEGHPGAPSRSLFFSRLCEWTGHLILLALWVTIYAGSTKQDAPFWLGGALLSAKLALLVHVIAWIRARTGHLRLGESWGLFGLKNLLLAMTAAALGFGFLVLGLTEAHRDLLGLFSATWAGALVLLILVGSQRSWAHMGRRTDPWI